MKNLTRKIQKGIRLIRKTAYQRLILRDQSKQKPIIFIMACHRSGTSIILSAFDKDNRSRTFGEFSTLHIHEGKSKLRFIPIQNIKRHLGRIPASFFALKPLAEIANADRLLLDFPSSQIVWIYRHYKDVASSNLKQFGTRNGIEDIRPLNDEDNENWRSFGASIQTKKLIQQYFSEDIKTMDAAALFWYSRNILFFEKALDKSNRVIIIKYEDLVTQPAPFFQHIYDKINVRYASNIIEDIHARSVGKGKSVNISAPIEELCEDIYQRLESVYKKQSFVS